MFKTEFVELANENARQVTKRRKMKRIKLQVIVWSAWVAFTVLLQYAMIWQNGEWGFGGNVFAPIIPLVLIIINLYMKG